MTRRGTNLRKQYTIHSATLPGAKMPKRKAGHLSNLRGHAEINTKRTRVRKAQKEEKENVQVSLGDSLDVFLLLTLFSATLARSRPIP